MVFVDFVGMNIRHSLGAHVTIINQRIFGNKLLLGESGSPTLTFEHKGNYCTVNISISSAPV